MSFYPQTSSSYILSKLTSFINLIMFDMWNCKWHFKFCVTVAFFPRVVPSTYSVTPLYFPRVQPPTYFSSFSPRCRTGHSASNLFSSMWFRPANAEWATGVRARGRVELTRSGAMRTVTTCDCWMRELPCIVWDAMYRFDLEHFMTTSWHWNIFHITEPCVRRTHRWIISQKTNNAELECPLYCWSEQTFEQTVRSRWFVAP